MKIKKLFNLFLLFFPIFIVEASFLRADEVLKEKFIPSSIIQLDKRFSHHVLIAEKISSTLYLYKFTDKNNSKNQNFKLIKTFRIATGLISGDKLIQGDKKTPEGIYFLNDFYNQDTLFEKYNDKAKEYGIGAFTLNYPNLVDLRKHKTGSGIWIHSTDNDSRVLKGTDSRGCIVLSKKDIYELSKYLEIKSTPIIIVQKINYLKQNIWEIEKTRLYNFVKNWESSWVNKDIDTYSNYYSKSQFFSNHKGGHNQFINYKKAVFNNPGKPIIKLKNLFILNYKDYAIVQFEQYYESKSIKDTGKKTLYLSRNKQYKWKIIAEKWQKIDPHSVNVEPFSPSIRYFKNENILATNESQ
jgi:murein L,D-transpeptidase YafK